jgi:hypothetical protein
MRRSTFIGWLAVLGVAAREGVRSGAMTTRSSTAQPPHRELVTAVRVGRCHSSRTTSRWSGYTRADLV